MRKLLLVSLQLTLLIAGTIPAVARGADGADEREPLDSWERLDKVQAQSHALQRRLFAARLQHDDDEIRRVTKEIKELQSQEVELLRATGQLPR